jgi:hypothetical protein
VERRQDGKRGGDRRRKDMIEQRWDKFVVSLRRERMIEEEGDMRWV